MAWSPPALGQTSDLESIDKQLTAAYQAVREAQSLPVDSVAAHEAASDRLQTLLLRDLANPVTFHGTLKELSRHFVIRTSEDRRIKFYSWDNQGGGTWHELIAFAQFSTDRGKVMVQPLTSKKESERGGYSDSLIQEVHEIMIGATKHYLTIGWGTHGNGLQHQIVRIYRIQDGKLAKCRCFAPGRKTDWVLEYPRMEKLNLSYDPRSQEIVWNELKLDPASGEFRTTGKISRLKLSGGKFR